MADKQIASDDPPANEIKGYWIVAPREGDDGLPDVFFKVVKTGCPQDQLNLKSSIETALTVVKHVFSSDRPLLNEFVARLLALSQAGLVGAEASTQVAAAALKSLEDEILALKAGPRQECLHAQIGCVGARIWVDSGDIALFSRQLAVLILGSFDSIWKYFTCLGWLYGGSLVIVCNKKSRNYAD